MLKFKFGAWAVVLMLTAFSFSACDDNDDETYIRMPRMWSGR